jgi:hypothetical protein
LLGAPTWSSALINPNHPLFSPSAFAVRALAPL